MRRGGVVLVVALLALVVLELLAVSALGFARLAQAASDATARAAVLRLAAENAAASVAAGIDARAAARRAPGSVLPVAAPAPAGIQVTTAVETLTDGYQLVRARALRPGGGAVQAAVLVRVLTPEALLRAFDATIGTHETTEPDPGWAAPAPEICGEAVLVPLAAPARWLLDAADTLPLGPEIGVSWADAMRIADSTAPAGQASPQLIYLTGPVTLTVAVHGVLAVDGDLTLAPGAAVRGLLTVRGTLIVLDGAEVAGAVRARAVAAGAAHIRPDRCAMAAALEAPALNRVYRPGPRWRLPAF